jgi:hypothetical protein
LAESRLRETMMSLTSTGASWLGSKPEVCQTE